jgi:ABC-type uncharacterized transport system YnjBCD permease subunit
MRRFVCVIVSMWLAMLVLMACGCVAVDKSLTVVNAAPCTYTVIDAAWASETDASGNTADVDPTVSVPLIP